MKIHNFFLFFLGFFVKVVELISMGTWNRKRVLVVFLVVVMVLGLWKGCEGLANKELLDSISLYKPQQENYEKMYQTLGKVVSKKEVRILVEGMVVDRLVQVGDVVKKDDVLLVYKVNQKSKKLLSSVDGIVCDVNEQFVSIVKDEDLWIQVAVPMKYSVQLQDKVDVGGIGGVVEKVARVASYKNGENYLDVFISCDGDFSLYEEVNVKMCVEQFEGVYRVPMEAVVRCKNKDYVIKEAWLRDTYELDIDDVVLVNVVGVENGFAVVSSEEVIDDRVCVFEGISLEFMEEMLEMYV